MWSGTVSFGLVSIPVSLFPGVRNTRVALRMLDEDGTPLSRRYYCPAEDEEIASEEIVRGYEIKPDEFVVVHDEELEALAPEKSRDIDLRRFVGRDEVDPVFYDRPYYLMPREGSSKAYRLLAQTMEETGRVGIATFVMRGKEYLIAILAEDGMLRAETLRFLDEIRTPADVGLGAPGKAARRDISRIEKAIEKAAASELDPAELIDERNQRIAELVMEKDRQGRDVVEVEVEAEPGEETVVDLMEKLQQSLRARGAERRPSSPPLPGYEKLSVAEVKKRLGRLGAQELRGLRDYEETHKNRATVKRALDRRLREVERPERRTASRRRAA